MISTRTTEENIDIRRGAQSRPQAVPSTLAHPERHARPHPAWLNFSRRCSEDHARPAERMLRHPLYESLSWVHFVVGIPGVRIPSELMKRRVWVGFAVILICGGQFMKELQSNVLHAYSGFVLRDGIFAVRGVLMGGPDTTQAVTRRRSDHISSAFSYVFNVAQTAVIRCSI